MSEATQTYRFNAPKKSKPPRNAPLPREIAPATTWQEWVRRHAGGLFAVAAIALGTMRIVATYPVFSHTVDEVPHIACGMEWLDRGTYVLEDQHPPLARVMAALGPYLSGIGMQGVWDKNHDLSGVFGEGEAIVQAGDNYDRTLALARLGILPFFWIACVVVYVWAKRYFGVPTGVVAVFLFSFLPAVLAHSAVATTDMALTAFVGAVFLAMLIWCEEPTDKRSILFGAMGALAILSKFSSLAFFPPAAGAALAAYLFAAAPGFRQLFGYIRRLLLPLALATGVAILIIWAGYRFHFGPVFFAKISLPAPELFSGIKSVYEHNKNGHPTYLLSQRSDTGWWYFFPIVLAIKTPIPFLLLAAFGIGVSLLKARQLNGAYLFPLGFALAILGIGMAGHINVGVRHILPIYIGLSITAAIGVIRLWEISRNAAWAQLFLGVFGTWFVMTSALAHPDYLAYFNFIAGDEPERIIADSDLDWGQDMKRLATRLQELHVPRITMIPLTFEDLGKRGLPPVNWGSADAPGPGWNAVSITLWKNMRMGVDSPWPDRTDETPVEHVGKGMLLYYFPEARPGS